MIKKEIEDRLEITPVIDYYSDVKSNPNTT